MGDFTYRTKEDVEEWKQRCPIDQLRQRAIDDQLVEATEFDTIDDEVKQLIAESREFAEDSPWPAPETATLHIYANPDDAPAAGPELWSVGRCRPGRASRRRR